MRASSSDPPPAETKGDLAVNDEEDLLRGYEPDEIRRWIRALCDRSGLSPTGLAKAAQIAPSTLNRFLNQPNVKWRPSARTLEKIAAVAEEHRQQMRELTAGIQEHGERIKKRLAALPIRLMTEAIDLGKRDLPVLGRAAGGTGELIISADHLPIDWTYRPPQLRGVADAFAVQATGESMHPMYKPGAAFAGAARCPARPRQRRAHREVVGRGDRQGVRAARG